MGNFFCLNTGFVLRLVVWWVNPPNNSFDDHLEPIAYYAKNFSSPPPEYCWQCYQPPLYYLVSSGVLHASYSIFNDFWYSWRSVQIISTISSSFALIVIVALLLLWVKNASFSTAISILLLAVLPRDLYTSSMVGNDAFLAFWVSLAVFGFCVIIFDKNIYVGSTILFVSCISAAWTKQSGIVALVLPCTILFGHFSPGLNLIRLNRRVLLMFPLAIAIAIFNEIWRWSLSGILLLSNQHFFNYAEKQAPGKVSLETFTTFKIFEIFRTPVLSEYTNGSFWTQIFSRFWYDFEPKFLPAEGITFLAARGMFVLGLVILPVLLLGIRSSFYKIPKQYAWGLLIMVLGFVCVAMMQTIRFPYYSSMKAVFILPCISVLCIWATLGFEKFIKLKTGGIFRSVLVIYANAVGLFHWVLILHLNDLALGLKSPIWRFPQLW